MMNEQSNKFDLPFPDEEETSARSNESPDDCHKADDVFPEIIPSDDSPCGKQKQHTDADTYQ